MYMYVCIAIMNYDLVHIWFEPPPLALILATRTLSTHTEMKYILVQNPCQYKESLMVTLWFCLISSIMLPVIQACPRHNQSLYLGCLTLILVVLDKWTSLIWHTVSWTIEKCPSKSKNSRQAVCQFAHFFPGLLSKLLHSISGVEILVVLD